MTRLSEYIRDHVIPDLDVSRNLEDELSDSKYDSQMPLIRQYIWDCIAQHDAEVKNRILSGERDEYVDAIGLFLEKFREAHPRKFDIITTNYDRVLEHIAAYRGVPFSDGMAAAELSEFGDGDFKGNNCINILKVHGSLSWFDVKEKVRRVHGPVADAHPVIIIPGKRKYREAANIPYRDLMSKADEAIVKANVFLVVGFGFNDEHITPKLFQKACGGTPVVVVTMEISEQCRHALQSARRFLFVEKDPHSSGKTFVTLRSGKSDEDVNYSVQGDYWRLPKFMEALS